MAGAQFAATVAVPGGCQAPHDDHGARLRSAIWDELVNSLLLTCASASIAISLAAGAPHLNSRLLARFHPSAPRLFGSPSGGSRDGLEVLGWHESVAEYYSHLTFAKDLSNRLDSSSDRDGSVHPGLCADTWRQLAAIGLKALEAMAVPIADQLSGATMTRSRTTAELLRCVIRGETPCLNAYGQVEIPLDPDRRSAPRTQHRFHAFFMVGSSLQRATVVNAGAYGLGVTGLETVEEGTRVLLLLRPGSHIAGRIVWARDGHQGIELDLPLPMDSLLHQLVH